MKTIQSTRNVNIIIDLADQWVRLMEMELYKDAYDLTSHDENGWSPKTIGEIIKYYDECKPGQKITFNGTSSEFKQRKDVTFIKDPENSRIGSIWYDLNIDGRTTDLTATFSIMDNGKELWLQLDNIHVM